MKRENKKLGNTAEVEVRALGCTLQRGQWLACSHLTHEG